MPGISLQRSLLRRGCSKRQPEERVLSVATLKRGDCRGDDIDQRGVDDSQEDLELVPHREEVAWDTKGTGEATAESSDFWHTLCCRSHS
jgi:hypothetical protein